MRKLIWLVLLSSASAQIPCPSNEVLNLPNDGPAAAPRACVNTALPSTKSAVSVVDSPSLAKALKCGSTVNLKPGKYGSVTFPTCTAGNWLVIKVAGSHVAVPGVRFNPKTDTDLAVFDHITTGSYVRIGPGIKIAQKVDGGYDSTMLDARGASHVILLRSWLHCSPTGECAHAYMATSGDHIAMSGNYVDGVKCIAGGRCGDAQGFLAGCGNAGAAYLVENNYIEASGENVMFGGCGAKQPPTDAIVRRNHFFKPLSWMQTDPSFGGVRYMVKNSFELKNCIRCLVEDNIMENTWGGFSQNGYTVLLTPRNQDGKSPNAQLSDTIFRFNHLIGGAGLQIAAARTGLMPDGTNPGTLGLWNLSQHDNLIEVDPKFYASAGIGLQLTLQDTGAKMDGINISNNTWTALRGSTLTMNSAIMFGSSKAGSLVFNGNILFAGKYQATTTGSPNNDCSKGLNGKPKLALDACWTNYTFSGNAVVGGNASWPAGTLTPSVPPASGGADMVALTNALAGVQ